MDAAITLAQAIGYQWITRDQVAEAAGVAAGTINNAFGSMVGLKRAVLQAAVERGIKEIVAQGMADGHPIARAAPAAVRRAALDHMSAS